MTGEIDRRRLLAGAGLAAGARLANAAPVPVLARHGSFLFGVATAAHQIEGNNLNSDYWVLENIPSTGFPDRSGDACDSWERWQEDVALVKAMGLNAYRFSLEWARIEPEPGHFSIAALDHYRRLCLACRAAGIEPVVTFHHFTSPKWLAAQGGWEDAGVVDRFARYCERAARHLAGTFRWACTLNEPNAQVNSYVVANGKPYAREAIVRAEAAKAVGSDRFCAYFQGDALKVRDQCIAAHRRGREAIKAAAPGTKVGITLALQDFVTGRGGEALHRQLWEEARLPFYRAAQGDDFVGVQSYNRLHTGPTGFLPTAPGQGPGGMPMDTPVDVPAAMVREAHRETGMPVLMTENGLNTTDDAVRIRYLRGVLDGLTSCVRDGIPLLGYIHWSLLDNFEWGSGYKPRFGLYACDRTTFRRTAKPSARIYAELVRTMRPRFERRA